MESQRSDKPFDSPLAVRLISLLLRPLIIVLSSTMVVYGLLSVRVSPSLDGAPSGGGVDGYVPWLRGALRWDLSPQVAERLGSTLQLLAAGLLLGLALALLFGSFLRSKSLGGLAGFAGMVASSIHPAVVAPTLLYWLAVEFRLFPVFGAGSFSDDPADALRGLVLPAGVVAFAIAPAMSTMVGRVRREDAPTGYASMAAAAADRSVSRFGWTVGFPFGTMLVALFAAETIFGRTGVISLALNAARIVDARVFLDVTFVIALIAALIGFSVDLVSLRSPKQPRHLAGPRPGLLGPVLGASTAALCVLGLLAVGLLAGGDAGLVGSISQANLDPFSSGHLLGTDQLGRDVLTLFVGGIPRLLGGALLAGLIAVLGGVTVAALWHLLGRGGGILSLLVDVAWWPGALILLAGFVVSSSWIWSVALTSVLLVPLAMRLAVREIAWTMKSGPWQLSGLVALVAAVALSVLLLAEFLGLGSRGGASIGGLLQGDLIRAPMRTAVIGIAVTALLFFLNLLGSSLVRVGWTRVPRLAVTRTDAAVAMAGPYEDPTMATAPRESTPSPPAPSPVAATPSALSPVPIAETIGADHAVWAPPTDAQPVLPPEVPRPDLETTRVGPVPDTPPGSPAVPDISLAAEDPTDPGVAPPVVPRPDHPEA